MSMTQLERALAEGLAKLSNLDIPAIIEAAQASCLGGPEIVQTVQMTPVTKVETPAPEPEKPKRTRKAEQPAPAPEPEKAAPPPPPRPPAPAQEPAAPAAGLNITGLIEGTGAQKKVVKDVFLAAVEKAGTLAALVALNDICDCGIPTAQFTEETAAVLRRRMTRWGMSLT